MRNLFVLAFTLSGCASPSLLSRKEYALSRIAGFPVICASAERHPCGITLMNCATGVRYECATDVEIMDLRELRQRIEKLKREAAERDSL